MAEKRVIYTAKAPDDESVGEEETWWEWFRYKYAKYWYGLIAIMAIFFTMLEFLRHDEWDWAVSGALISGLCLTVLFALGYMRLWWKDDEEDDLVD